MSETEPKFEIEINEKITLHRGSIIEHIDHGPMRIDSILAGPHHKTADLKSELSPHGLELTGDELREQWSETIAQDPADLHDPGTARFQNTGVSAEGSDIEVDLTVKGPEKDAETVLIHTVDQTVRAIQAVRDENPPSDCEGAGFGINWETRFEDN